MKEHTAFNDDFAYEVLSVVEEIPEGQVATHVNLKKYQWDC